jgi:hypothetical protein
VIQAHREFREIQVHREFREITEIIGVTTVNSRAEALGVNRFRPGDSRSQGARESTLPSPICWPPCEVLVTPPISWPSL